ncbi:uncharacterized protein [Mytilus edulis]|uniref:uncharacterized protein n=1 Tax=Mytilus edulis TaxID=6550 RepID=UPI0039EFBD72
MFDAGFDYFKLQNTTMYLYTFLVAILLFGNEIHGSENLAVNRPTDMSEPEQVYNPEIVVDGDTYQGECIQTTTQVAEAWWQVRLREVSAINTLHIFYKETETPFVQKRRFAGFSVYVSNGTTVPSGERCYHHGGDKYPELNQEIQCKAVGRIVTIIIQRPPEEDFTNSLCVSNHALLELCEVEVNGCGVGFYGTECTSECPTDCVDGQCDPVTGDCRYGCVDGYFGPKCEQDCENDITGCIDVCPVNCASQACDLFGACREGCQAGWQGTDCTSQCGAGFYGENCETRCFCDHGACDSQNGSCPDSMCLEGWEPPTCSRIALQQSGNGVPEGMVNSSTFYAVTAVAVITNAVLLGTVVKLACRLKLFKKLPGIKGQKKKVLSVFKSKKQSNSTDTPKTKNKQKQLPSRKAVNDYTPTPNKDYYLDPVNTSYNEVIDRQSKADMNIYEGLDDEDYYSVSK